MSAVGGRRSAREWCPLNQLETGLEAAVIRCVRCCSYRSGRRAEALLLPSSRWETDVGHVIAGKESVPVWKGRRWNLGDLPETIGEAIK